MITKDWLEQARIQDGGVRRASDSQIAEYLSQKDESFAAEWNKHKSNFGSDRTLATKFLNYKAYGDANYSAPKPEPQEVQPDLQSLTSTKEEGFFKRALQVANAPVNYLTGVAEEGIGRTAQFLGADSFGQRLRNQTSDVQQRQNLADVGSFARNTLPIAAGIATGGLGAGMIGSAGKIGIKKAAATVAGSGVVGSVIEDLTDQEKQTLGQVAGKAVGLGVLEGTLDAATAGGFKYAKAAIKSAPIDKAAKKLLSSTLKIKPNLRARIAKNSIAGVSPEDWMLANGIQGGSIEDITSQLQKLHQDSYNLLNESLAGIDDVVSKSEAPRAWQALDLLDEQYNGAIGLEDLQAGIQSLKSQDNLTLSQLTEVKRLIDDADMIYKTTGDVKSSVTAKGLSNVRRDIKELIEQRAIKYGVDVKGINKTTQISREIADAIESSWYAKANNNAISIRDLISAGIGSSMGPVGFIAGGLASAVARNPVVKSKLAVRLANLSGADQKLLKMALKGEPIKDSARVAVQALIQTITNGLIE